MIFKMKKGAKTPETPKQNKDVVATPNKVATKSGGIGALIKELQTLDVENYGNWSKPIQMLTWSMTALFVAGVGFGVASYTNIGLINMERDDRVLLLQTYKEKQEKLKGAEQYKQQLVEIETGFNQQLQQLPKETEIPGLIDDLNRAGKQSGLKFEDIKLGVELPKEFFIEQPIEIKAKGDFHSFGAFLEAVSKLPRIVAVKGFTIKDVGSEAGFEAGLPKIEYSIQASTYRYLEGKKSAVSELATAPAAPAAPAEF